MDFNEYQDFTTSTVKYPKEDMELWYTALGLAGETGEVCEKIKKLYRDDNGILTEAKRLQIKREMGDVLWYMAQMARVLGYTFSSIPEENIKKLKDRTKRGVVQGDGDNR